MIRVGHGAAGEGAHAVQVTVVLGPIDGPVGSAWTSALAVPAAGVAPFLVLVRPGLAVRPFTLLVPAGVVVEAHHARLVRGPVHAGVAAAVGRAIGDGVVSPAGALSDVLIANVVVDAAATDDDAVHAASRAATYAALHTAGTGRPTLDEVVAEASRPWNAAYRSATEGR